MKSIISVPRAETNMHPSESCRREPPPMTRPRPSASFLKSAEASAAAQRHRTGRMATSRAHVRLAASAPTSTVLARRATRMPRLSARAPTPRAGVFPTVLRLRAFAAVPIARARPRGSPEPPLRAIRALHPPRRVAIISRSASASWPLGPGGPAPDPRTPRPDHDDVSIPEWALIQIPRGRRRRIRPNHPRGDRIRTERRTRDARGRVERFQSSRRPQRRVRDDDDDDDDGVRGESVRPSRRRRRRLRRRRHRRGAPLRRRRRRGISHRRVNHARGVPHARRDRIPRGGDGGAGVTRMGE